MKRTYFKHFAFMFPVRAMVAAFLLLLGAYFPDCTLAQTQRFQQLVDLKHPDNSPMFVRGQSLPDMVDKGIRSGALQPLLIDYEKNEVKPLSLEKYRLRLAYIPVEIDTGDAELEINSINYSDTEDSEYIVEDSDEEAENVNTSPTFIVNWLPDENLKKTGYHHSLRWYELDVLLMDVSKKNGKVEKLNYIHFYGAEPETEAKKYRFSVRYADLNGYLINQRALWVGNKNPLILKNQVLNTNNWAAADRVSELFPEVGFGKVRLIEKKPFRKKAIEIYAYNRLVKRMAYADLLAIGREPVITWMDEALNYGLYQTQKETPLTTAIPAEDETVSLAAEPYELEILQKEILNLDRPENKKYFRNGQELSTLIYKAYKDGLIKNAYADDSLTTILTNSLLAERMMFKNNDVLEIGAEDQNSVPLIFSGRDLSVFEITWKIKFSDKGEIITALPHAVSLVSSEKATPMGLEIMIASFAFNEVENGLLKLPEYQKAKGNMLADLRKRKYFAFFQGTSGLRSADAPL